MYKLTPAVIFAFFTVLSILPLLFVHESRALRFVGNRMFFVYAAVSPQSPSFAWTRLTADAGHPARLPRLALLNLRVVYCSSRFRSGRDGRCARSSREPPSRMTQTVLRSDLDGACRGAVYAHVRSPRSVLGADVQRLFAQLAKGCVGRLCDSSFRRRGARCTRERREWLLPLQEDYARGSAEVLDGRRTAGDLDGHHRRRSSRMFTRSLSGYTRCVSCRDASLADVIARPASHRSHDNKAAGHAFTQYHSRATMREYCADERDGRNSWRPLAPRSVSEVCRESGVVRAIRALPAPGTHASLKQHIMGSA